jgi:protein phosphatase PTC1
MQKLGKSDPALNVPQGSLNNSAGESAPGPRSTFRVGVTEDKNKKCRRTMEDTHAYLYNFLSTPAPNITPVPNAPLTRAPTGFSLFESKTNDSTATDLSLSPRVSVGNKDMVETDNGYFAIFDGHAGTFAADWCGKKVHLLLEDIIRKNPNSPIPELLDQTFTLVDQQLEKLPLKNSGTTAVVAVLRWEDRIPNSQSATGSTAIAPATAQAASQGENTDSTPPEQLESKLRESASRQRVLYTANVGDARIILCRNGKALRLSYDHKGGDENEGKRIAGAGGLILNNRVNGVLAVTRALGDAYMKDLVTGHPYTTETVIQPDIDEFLILACDGVSDIGERDPDTLTAPLLISFSIALGRVLRSGSRRPRPQCPGPTTWLQDAGRSRPRPLLHRQPLVYDGPIRHDCSTSGAGEQGQSHRRRG